MSRAVKTAIQGNIRKNRERNSPLGGTKLGGIILNFKAIGKIQIYFDRGSK